ncbi:conserved oligomeric Golgi complex subunit 7 [Tetranychus urticae]|uniref:Conserved oligomeric Golgi complex subunit 7 n=1 Tax=Tetranychus urticae TaxID=32264 RepID=T1KAX9_TETUR|nr:conserved oligomeric Golgi complex subunit 7 [Tetranychus urticae]
MDFKAFTEENFNSVDWINDTLNSAPKEENRENYASNIVYKLQLFIQEINQSLEETALSVIGNLPKLNRDIDVLCEQARTFKNDLVAIKGNVDKLSMDSDLRMSQLAEIDHAKQVIEDKLVALNEINNRDS